MSSINMSDKGKTARLIYIYRRALVILSKATEKDVLDKLDCTYEEYVKGVAHKHLELGAPYESEDGGEDIDFDVLVRSLEGETINSDA